MAYTVTARHILKDGKPLFYLADTAWELFHRLTLEEATHYLTTRAAQKFTVIQAVLLAEFDGLRTPNPYGHLPLDNNDPTQPDEGYFQDCDKIIRKASALGLTMALLPSWGDKWNKGWGQGPEIFTPENARTYATFLASRYKNDDILWVLGGDREITTDKHLAIIRAMADAIRSVTKDQLITFHPNGGFSSSKPLHTETWLDFNMLQSGHTGRNNPVATMISRDLALKPPKPALDSEPNYEDHPVMLPGWKDIDGFFDTHDIRKQAWRSLLAGAAGHTYGCHPIWQFFDPKKNKPVNRARTPWQDALHLPGATHMQHLRSFFESLPSSSWTKLVPDLSLIKEGQDNAPPNFISAARANDHTWQAFYIPQAPNPRTFTLTESPLKPAWFNPRTADRTPATGPTFTTPTAEDWVLLRL